MRPPPKPAANTYPLTSALLVALALASAAISFFSALGLWHRLPAGQLRALDDKAVSAAFANRRATMSPEAQDALVLNNLASLFTAAYQHPDVLTAQWDSLRTLTRRIRISHVGRLQQAAFALLAHEHARRDPRLAWPVVEPYITGLDRPRFEHFQPQLLRHYAAVYQDAGIQPGTAARCAAWQTGYAHGPWLQFLVDRLSRIARQRRDAGEPEHADACERIVHQLLRSWLLQQGVTGLRLLAADLLAEQLQHNAQPRDPQASLRHALLDWRNAYRNAAKAQNQPPILLRIGEERLDPDITRRLVTTLTWVGWLIPALVPTTAVLLLALVWRSRQRHTPSTPWRSALIAAILAAAANLTTAAAVANIQPQWLHADFRRAVSPQTGPPRLPWIAGAIALAAGGATFAARAKQNRPRPSTRAAAFLLLLLSCAALAGTAVAEQNRRKLELDPWPRLIDTPSPNTSAQAAAVLDALRNWRP